VASTQDKVSLFSLVNGTANNPDSCLAHVINLGTQRLISTYSKAPHYDPHNPHAHEPDLAQRLNRDEIGLVRSICVKERSSAKRKELYRSVQTKAGVSFPTQLLIDMKVRWSSTYIMLNRADCNKQV
jgi:hypothetical protein